jgi:hypothetical protein
LGLIVQMRGTAVVATAAAVFWRRSVVATAAAVFWRRSGVATAAAVFWRRSGLGRGDDAPGGHRQDPTPRETVRLGAKARR